MNRLLLGLTLLSGTLRAEWRELVGKPAPALGVKTWTRPVEAATLEELGGHLLLIEFWSLDGLGVDRVRALNRLRSRFEVKGLRILAPSAAPKKEIEETARKRGITYSIGAFEGQSPYGGGELPYAFLVAPSGKVVWQGAAAELDRALLLKQLRSAKPFRLQKVEKSVEPAAAAFRKGKLGEAEELARAVDPAVADSERLIARIDSIRGFWRARAEAAAQVGEYGEAANAFERLKRLFPKTETAADADAHMKGPLATKETKREIKAARALEKLFAEGDRAGTNEKKRAALAKKLEKFAGKEEGTLAAMKARVYLDEIRGDPALAHIRKFIEKERIDNNGAGWRTSLPQPPKLQFSSTRSYFWTLETNQGVIKIKFLPQTAPMHVSSTIYLTELGFYDRLRFHRVITGFMAQGGCPLGNGMGKPGYTYDGEFDANVNHDRGGLLSTANSGPGTDGSQFFLTFKATPHLNGKHTIFGEVVEGMDTLKKLEALGSRGGATKEKLFIEKATISVQ